MGGYCFVAVNVYEQVRETPPSGAPSTTSVNVPVTPVPVAVPWRVDVTVSPFSSKVQVTLYELPVQTGLHAPPSSPVCVPPLGVG